MNTEVEEKRARLLAELAALDEPSKAAATGAPVVGKPFYLSRRRAAMFLEATYGARISNATLAGMAVRGNGPAFHKLGHHVVYEPADLTAWAEARLSAKVHSTSGLAPSDPFRRRPGRPRMKFGAPMLPAA
jgi:hypothetical protein